MSGGFFNNKKLGNKDKGSYGNYSIKVSNSAELVLGLSSTTIIGNFIRVALGLSEQVYTLFTLWFCFAPELYFNWTKKFIFKYNEKGVRINSAKATKDSEIKIIKESTIYKELLENMNRCVKLHNENLSVVSNRVLSLNNEISKINKSLEDVSINIDSVDKSVATINKGLEDAEVKIVELENTVVRVNTSYIEQDFYVNSSKIYIMTSKSHVFC